MKPLLPVLSLAFAIAALAGCNDATTPAGAPSAAPPVADAPPADAGQPGEPTPNQPGELIAEFRGRSRTIPKK